MKDEILTEIAKRNMFIQPDALEYLESSGKDMVFVRTLLSSVSTNKFLITKTDVVDFLNGDKGLMTSEKVIPNKVKLNGEFIVLKATDITGNSTCEAKIEDFVKYFKSRYDILSNIIKDNNPSFEHALPIAKARKLDRDVCIIGMVYDVSITKNGHKIIQLEDYNDKCSVFINKDSPLMQDPVITDEVIGVKGKFSPSGLFILDRIARPSVPKNNQWIPSDTSSSIAFLSDIHIGSKEFLQKGWDNMMYWLKHNAERQGINYLVLSGDVVDGIGAYPGQEDDLEILDIYKQYEVLAEYLKEIPDHMQVLMHPGNHDACRLAEPQPALKDIYTKKFDSNINITGNPISIKVEDRVITSYHGKSFDDWIGAIPGAAYEKPLEIMEHMVEKRHLAPIYGKKNALAPEVKDYLALQPLPDILVTGHIHNVGVEDYKGIKLIQASSYQAQTDYQKQHNFIPVPCKMPVVHLGTGRVTLKNFMK